MKILLLVLLELGVLSTLGMGNYIGSIKEDAFRRKWDEARQEAMAQGLCNTKPWLQICRPW